MYFKNIFNLKNIKKIYFLIVSNDFKILMLKIKIKRIEK